MDEAAPVQPPVVETWFDTAGRDLRRRGTTLRRVEGGPEGAGVGWHLEIGLGEHPDDVQAPLSAGRRVPPRSLRDLVLALTLDEPLEEVPADEVAAPAKAARAAKVGKVGPGKPASRLLHRYLLDQHEALLLADLAVRRREPRAVHDLRVALRRLRSTLATYRPLVERSTTDPLRVRMREVSHLLGDGRDAEVVGDALHRLLDEEPADLRLGAARRTLGDERRNALRLGRRTVDDTVHSPDYVAMLRALAEVVDAPPWRPEADAPARMVAPRRIAKDLQRLRRRMAAANEAGGPAERARLLHEARKAAKRLRYACEAAAPTLGVVALRLSEASEDLQDVLGDHHDTMTTRSVLRRLAGRADLHPGTAFTLGRLHAREEHRARRLEREADTVWAALDRPKVTGWL